MELLPHVPLIIIGAVCAIVFLYCIVRVGAVAWFRTKRQYDADFIYDQDNNHQENEYGKEEG